VLREAPLAYRHIRLRLQQDGVWCDADIANSCLLEMMFPLEDVVLSRQGEPEVVLQPSTEAAARLLALAVDHVDTLLEDWYPTLGTRFVHTSEVCFSYSMLLFSTVYLLARIPQFTMPFCNAILFILSARSS